MTDADRMSFAEAMHVLGETFNEPVSDVRTEGYFDALREFPMVDVASAVRMALRTCKFFPRPVELRELITGKSEDRADAAWGELVREVRRVGYIGQPQFADARVMRAIRETWGTWQRLCETLPNEGPELVGWIKQFKAAYQSSEGLDTTKQLTVGDLAPNVRRFIQNARTQKAITAAEKK